MATHQPRKMIGPDHIKCLRDLALSHSGQRNAFDGCIVPLMRGGMPATRIDVNKMREPKGPQELTYGALISHAITRACDLSRRIRKYSPYMQASMLDDYLRKAESDAFLMWTLSAASLRKLIFPGAYFGKRCDGVRYCYNASDAACGTMLPLKSLTANDVSIFTGHARRLFPAIRPEAIKPISLQP